MFSGLETGGLRVELNRHVRLVKCVKGLKDLFETQTLLFVAMNCDSNLRHKFSLV